MTTPIDNGIYNIQNVQYSGTAVNLIGGEPNGALTGFPLNGYETSPNLRWTVNNVGNNQVTLESVAQSGYYAAPASDSKGAPLYTVQTTTPPYWRIEQVSSGVYLIQSGDGWQWSITNGDENGSIFLGPVEKGPGPEQQWTFTPVPQSS